MYTNINICCCGGGGGGGVHTTSPQMLSSGIPQLRREEDLAHLHKALQPQATDASAAKTFKSLVYKSLDTKTTQLNFAVHILAHRD